MLASARRLCCKWWWHMSGNDWWVSPRTKQSSPKKYRISWSVTFSMKRRNGRMWLFWPSHLVRKSSKMWWIASGRGRFCHLNRLDMDSSASRKFHGSHQDNSPKHQRLVFPKRQSFLYTISAWYPVVDARSAAFGCSFWEMIKVIWLRKHTIFCCSGLCHMWQIELQNGPFFHFNIFYWCHCWPLFMKIVTHIHVLLSFLFIMN